MTNFEKWKLTLTKERMINIVAGTKYCPLNKTCKAECCTNRCWDKLFKWLNKECEDE